MSVPRSARIISVYIGYCRLYYLCIVGFWTTTTVNEKSLIPKYLHVFFFFKTDRPINFIWINWILYRRYVVYTHNIIPSNIMYNILVWVYYTNIIGILYTHNRYTFKTKQFTVVFLIFFQEDFFVHYTVIIFRLFRIIIIWWNKVLKVTRNIYIYVYILYKRR